MKRTEYDRNVETLMVILFGLSLNVLWLLLQNGESEIMFEVEIA